MAFKVNENAFEKRKEMLSANSPSLTKEGSHLEENKEIKPKKTKETECAKSIQNEPVKACSSISLTPASKAKKDVIFSVAITQNLKNEIDHHIKEVGWKNRNEFINELLAAYFENLENRKVK